MGIKEANMAAKTPGIPGTLSLFFPGAGQVWNGRFIWAIFWFVFTPGLWIGTGGLLGWVMHIFSAVQAWNQATRS